MVKFGLHARIAQRLHKAHALAARRFAHSREIHAHGFGRRNLPEAFRHKQEAFHAQAKPNARHLRAAELLQQAIIPSAAADRPLVLPLG